MAFLNKIKEKAVALKNRIVKFKGISRIGD